MSRMTSAPIEATQANKNNKFPIPTSGMWSIAYGKDHTPMGYFIDFTPLDDVAKSQRPVSWDGRDEPDDEPAPKDEWLYSPITLDQLFTRPSFTAQDWVNILYSFGIEG